VHRKEEKKEGERRERGKKEGEEKNTLKGGRINRWRKVGGNMAGGYDCGGEGTRTKSRRYSLHRRRVKETEKVKHARAHLSGPRLHQTVQSV
jgi:hypothetical protein